MDHSKKPYVIGGWMIQCFSCLDTQMTGEPPWNILNNAFSDGVRAVKYHYGMAEGKGSVLSIIQPAYDSKSCITLSMQCCN